MTMKLLKRRCLLQVIISTLLFITILSWLPYTEDDAAEESPLTARHREAICRNHVDEGIRRLERHHNVCLSCPTVPDSKSPDEDVCARYTREGLKKKTAILNALQLIGFRQVRHHSLATLATQMSPDRLDKLEALSRRWKGPMSVSVYISNTEVRNFFASSVCMSTELQARADIVYHVVLSTGQEFYPVNVMRNVALRGVHTEYIFMTDVDILPSPTMFSSLTARLTDTPPATKEVWVIPVFETTAVLSNQTYETHAPPVNKSELIVSIERGEIQQFMKNTKELAHNATDTIRWCKATKPYKVDYEEDYEPYIVIKTSEMPAYYTRFLGRIRDKLSHLLKLFYMGYEFTVLPDVYGIHLYHATRQGAIKASKEYIRCAMELYGEYKRDLIKTYGNRPLKSQHFVPY